MDAITLLAGAGILLAGVLIGEVHGRIAARRQRPKPPPEPVCGCKHSLARHDRDAGVCHAAWLEDRKQYEPGHGTREWQERVQCTCRQYVGPEPAETLGTLLRLLPSPTEGGDR